MGVIIIATCFCAGHEQRVNVFSQRFSETFSTLGTKTVTKIIKLSV